jgi:N-acetylmuramoyl-L-alanine amidase
VQLRWFLPSLLGVLFFALPAQAGKLTFWRFDSDQRRLDWITDEGIQPKAQLITNPTRLVIDLPNTSLGQPPTEQKVGGKIRQVRVGQFDPQTTRLVIELGSKYSVRPEEVGVRSIAPNRWFVQLPKLQHLSKAERKRLSTQNPIAIAVPPLPIPKPLPPLSPPQRGVTVVIDPGHGGPDVGAIGIGGLQEKRVVFPIALEVTKFLEARGLHAVLTRSDDRDLDLPPRVALAERLKAKAFVSIHANSINLSHPEVNGLETYYYDTGAGLARMIHNQVLQSVSIHDRQVRQARFYVLRNTSMPAVLVEVGFVTGREDAPQLVRTEYQKQMAQAIATGILQYLRLHP